MKNLTNEQVQSIKDMIDACGVFTAPNERLKHWDEYKQDAADRLRDIKIMLESE